MNLLWSSDGQWALLPLSKQLPHLPRSLARSLLHSTGLSVQIQRLAKVYRNHYMKQMFHEHLTRANQVNKRFQLPKPERHHKGFLLPKHKPFPRNVPQLIVFGFFFL